MGRRQLDSLTTRVSVDRRHEAIVESVRRTGSARVSDLAATLGVSGMTIRRDLEMLHADGVVEKTHGGARAIDDRSTDEPGFEVKSRRNINEKQAITRAAARYVRPGIAIGVTAGTTTWQFASELAVLPELIIVTNSVRVADILHQMPRPDRTVILTGGVRTTSDALVGPVACQALRGLHLDIVFMGVHGMSERAGFTSPNLGESETNRAFVAASNQLIVLADHTKWGVTGLSSFAELQDADTVITDAGLPAEAIFELEQRRTHVVIADAPSSERIPTHTRSSEWRP